jgi:hypothetical protein
VAPGASRVDELAPRHGDARPAGFAGGVLTPTGTTALPLVVVLNAEGGMKIVIAGSSGREASEETGSLLPPSSG